MSSLVFRRKVWSGIPPEGHPLSQARVRWHVAVGPPDDEGRLTGLCGYKIPVPIERWLGHEESSDSRGRRCTKCEEIIIQEFLERQSRKDTNK